LTAEKWLSLQQPAEAGWTAEGTAQDEGQELAQGVEAEGRIGRGPPWTQGIRS
jgi:hypothetical protein